MSTTPRLSFHLFVVAATFAVAIGGALGFLALGGSLPGGGGREVRALVPNAGQLAPGARVTMAGAEVGAVSGIERRGTAAVVRLRITDERVLPLAADSRVAVRQRTPIGENYMDVVPGRSRTNLGEDDVLPVAAADEYVDADQVLSVLQGRARTRTRRLLKGVGGGLDGRGKALNRTVGGVSDTFIPATKVIRTLHETRTELSRLIDRFGRVVASTAERGEALRRLARDGDVAVRAVASRDDELRDLVRELPPTLRQAERTSGVLDRTTRVSAPVVEDLAAAVRELRPAVRSLRPAAQQGREILRDLTPAAPRLAATLDGLESASGPTVEALPKLRSVLCQADPMLEYLEPYAKDVAAFVVGFGSATNSYDGVGHLVRLAPVFRETTLVGLPPEARKAAHTLLGSGALSTLTGPIDFDPYPKPNSVGRTSSLDRGEKAILGPKELAESGFEYPRIMPGC